MAFFQQSRSGEYVCLELKSMHHQVYCVNFSCLLLLHLRDRNFENSLHSLLLAWEGHFFKSVLVFMKVGGY